MHLLPFLPFSKKSFPFEDLHICRWGPQIFNAAGPGGDPGGGAGEGGGTPAGGQRHHLLAQCVPSPGRTWNCCTYQRDTPASAQVRAAACTAPPEASLTYARILVV